MRFPNAATGVKRIFTAEILLLISAIASVFGLGTLVVTLFAAKGGSQAGTFVAGGATAVFLLAASVLSIIAFIMNIVGISNASKDEAAFKTALICVIVGIIASVIGSFFMKKTVLYSICNTVSSVAGLLVTVFVITGIIKLADQLNNAEVSNKGSNVLKMIIVVNVLAIIAGFIVIILGGQTASVVAGILALVAAVLNVVQYIMFLTYLAKAKVMLANS